MCQSLDFLRWARYNPNMRVCNLSSGSDGNATYIETSNTRILVDAGLSCKELELRLGNLGVQGCLIDAILITHEHSDHIKGLDVFAAKFGTTVFVHEDGFEPLVGKLKKNLDIITFDDNPFFVKDLKILPIEVPHDVVRCTGFVIAENEKKVSIFTDLGHTTSKMLQNLYGSALVFLEANHDPDKLYANPRYPIYLKKRIIGNRGHLSNKACAEAILDLAQHGCKQFVLSHLSTENNSPNFAYDFITNLLCQNGIVEGQHIRIDVASTVPKAIFRL